MKKIASAMSLWQWAAVAMIAFLAIGGTAIAGISGTTAVSDAVVADVLSDVDLSNLDLIDSPAEGFGGMAGGSGGGASGGGGADIQVAQYN